MAAKALAHWLTTGVPLVVVTPLLGLLLNLESARHGRGGADAAGRHPGADLHRADRRGAVGGLRRGGLLLAVLVLPLTVPVLIFGVAAANAAIVGPLPFGTPFTILCALTLVEPGGRPFAAAAALRHGME